MVASDFEITRSPSCGPNNNLCLDSKQYSSPSPSYLSLHQPTSDENTITKPNPNPVTNTNSQGIISIIPEKNEANGNENFHKIKLCENNKIRNDKSENGAPHDHFNKLENGK